MSKVRKQTIRKLFLASVLIFMVSTAVIPTPLLAQPRTKGTDPTVLAKAKAGDPASQARVGYAYDYGDGVTQDSAQAAFWYRKAADGFRKAAEQGNADAQSYLGFAYDHGHGVPQNYTQAAAWYGKAAEQGNVDAEMGLAILYTNGTGVPQSYAQAAAWYRKAAEQDDVDAQLELAVLYRFGRGVPQSYAQAAAWFRKAAEQGDAGAQTNLGKIYRYGQGVPQDYAQSAFWYEKAANNKYRSMEEDEEAKEALETFAAIDKSKRGQLLRFNFVVLGYLSGLAGLGFVVVRYRRKFISYSKSLVPRSTRAKQLAVLFPVASWCSACCLYQVLDPMLMRHPINAAVTALLFSVPALIFGAISLWWLSQGRNKG
jgi:hypothetical protein